MTGTRGVWHPRTVTKTSTDPMIGEYVSGRLLEQAEAEARRAMAAGYSVDPVPGDGQDHPRSQRCPICSAKDNPA